jgi:putative tryptophan/tyrosine transport system substrate-binding protein
MKRREFIAIAGGAAAWPLAARAQQPALPVIAFINGGVAEGQAARLAGFRKGLNATGYAEGQNATVEYHWLDSHYERLPALLVDLVRRRVSVIATLDTASALPAKNATTTIPIVFAVAENPVTLGLVANLAQPGDNATGINFFTYEIDAKRLGLMHELLPRATRFAVLLNPANAASAAATSKSVKEAARALGLEALFFNASTPSEIDAAFAALVREPTDGLFIAGDAFFTSRAAQLATLAVRDRIPASFSAREMVEAGLLMSYGTNFPDTWRQVGVYAGSILKGAKPAEVPVLQSTKFEFVINVQTAKSVGIEVPPTLLARADDVIE